MMRRTINTHKLREFAIALGSRGIERLAIEADLSFSTTEKMLRGEVRNPTLETIEKLLRVTGCEFDELFPLTGNEKEVA